PAGAEGLQGRLHFRRRAADGGDRPSANGAAAADAARRALNGTRADAREGDLRHRRAAQSGGGRGGAPGRAECHHGFTGCSTRLCYGEWPDSTGRGCEDDQPERGHQGVLSGPDGRGTAQELSGRQALPPTKAVAVVSALLEIREASKAFGGVQAVTRVSLEAQKGEILSVIGPNGAGKTTVLNMISGFYHPDSGRITLERQDITELAPSRVAELGIARTFQNIALFRGMTVLDNLMLGRHVHMNTAVLGAFPYRGLAATQPVHH